MPPRMLPTATPRLPDSAALAMMAISGRLVATASRISPPSAEPRCSRVDSTSVWSDSWMPATQIAPAAPMKTITNSHDGQPQPRGHSAATNQQKATQRGTSTAKATTVFGIAAAVTLIAGVVVERSGNALADHIGLSGVLFGATILAAATSLPELSTGLTSVRNGDYQLAMSDIFGGNAFLPVLFLMATLLSGNAVLPQAQHTDIYLTALAIVLTLIYAAGLLFRPQKRIAGMGVDSLAVIVVYAVGVAAYSPSPTPAEARR